VATSAWGLLQKNPAAPSGRQPRLPAARARVEALLGRQAPALPLWIPVLLGVGILLWFFLPFVGQRRAALLVALALVALGAGAPGRLRLVVTATGLLVALGLLAAELRFLTVAEPQLYHRVAGPIEGRVRDIAPWRGGEGARLWLRRTDGHEVLLLSPFAPQPWLLPDAQVRVEARFEPRTGPLVPGGYDPFRQDLFAGLSASGRATAPPQLLAPAPRPAGLSAAAALLRLRIGAFLDATLGRPRGAVAAAFAIGSQGGIPTELRRAFQTSGLSHLLTVSGFHVGLVAAGLFGLARRLPLLLAPARFQGRSTRAPAALLAAVGAFAYVLVAGAEVPAVRAGLMVGCVLLALALGRDALSPRLLALAAALILLARPEALLSASFQLSFAAVATLVLLGHAFPPPPDPGGPLQRAGRWLYLMLLTALAIELVLLPIAAAHFGRAGVYGVLANALAIPLSALVIMPLVGLHLLLGPMGLGVLTAPPLALAIDLLAGLATHVAALPGALVQLPAVPRSAALLAVAGTLLLLLVRGRGRLVGLPFLVLALGLQLLAPRPDIFVTPGAAQIGVRGPVGTLYVARGRGESRAARTLAETVAARRILPLSAYPGAVCTQGGCSLRLGGSRPLVLLVVTSDLPLDRLALARACAAADIVIAPRLRGTCAPRWLRLDRRLLSGAGALAISSRTGRIESAGALAGDHAWSPSALPGVEQRLLGRPGWSPPLAQ
jgi:competence protein ComEC